MAYLLAIDQGTTSSRAILFDEIGNILGSGQQEFAQYFPQNGWVEHDPEEIWTTTVSVMREALSAAAVGASELAAIGITNQRETTVIWDRLTGKPIHRAIVWQDRRTEEFCDQLRQEGFGETVSASTGLLIDPYFSATKVKWLLDNVEGAREKAEKGDLAFGTIDSFLLWRLTGGKVHKTDATNASRTMLFNIHTQEWDRTLLERLDIPASLLPEVEDCAADFGKTDPDLLGAPVAVAGMAGDQQAALFGQCCFEDGMTKSTYGTGCFVIANTGSTPVVSKNRLLTTVGYRLQGEVTYGLEGSIFIAGAAIQWIRDGLRLIGQAHESEAIARQNPQTNGVYLVPAFTGLGAPWWDANARGAILGLSRDSSLEDVVTAALQSVSFQTRDLLHAMGNDGAEPTLIRVDGGMVVNDWFSQCLADILGIPVDRPVVTETTALGAAWLAGLQVGVYDSLSVLPERWKVERQFQPAMASDERERLYRGWQVAVSRVRTR
ncbi:MAG: glycerol kinase GlpK [Pseudomonadales bacterium]|nr:glycerol kinase GlpK [Pseudomonadales bacterium]